MRSAERGRALMLQGQSGRHAASGAGHTRRMFEGETKGLDESVADKRPAFHADPFVLPATPGLAVASHLGAILCVAMMDARM